MKLKELLEKKFIEKINESEYKCCKCNNIFTKLGVINHHFYTHENEGIKKREQLKQKALSNNNKPEMKEKISQGTKKAFERNEVKENFKRYTNRLKTERLGKNNPMFGKTHTDEWRENHSNLMKDFKHNDVTKQKIRESKIGTKHTPESIMKMRLKKIGKKQSIETIKKRTLKQYGRKAWNKLNIKNIKEKYPFFSQIEEMRYNPDKTREKEIQVRCKNHNCKNSKEKGGWFTPSHERLKDRIYAIENEKGNDGNYLYCSDECKNQCPLFGLNPTFEINKLNQNELPYTPNEYQQFREYVLERDEYKCQYCGEKAEHVHHERPQKLEPFYSLDPDYAISVCKDCHYEKGHKDECSTGNLANINCSERLLSNDSI